MTRLRNAARVAAGLVVLLAAVLAFGWVGYLMLDNARRPVSLLAFVIVMALYGALLVWVLVQRRDDRELIDKAVDDADRALAAVTGTVRADDAARYGRHAARSAAPGGSRGGADHLRTPDSTPEAVTDRLRAITGTTEGAA